MQTTVRTSVSCAGTGLHCGEQVNMQLHPAPAGTGIIFRRIDLLTCNSLDAQAASLHQVSIKASPANVAGTQLGTSLVNDHGIEISTVEHLMAAFAGYGVDNVIVEVDNAELPIMDGSAEPFLKLIERAGLRQLNSPKFALRIKEKISVQDGDRWAYALPLDEDEVPGFNIDVLVDYIDPAIGKQRASMTVTPAEFQANVAPARTFCYLSDVEAMRARGLALGGSYDNAIVVNNGQIENEGGLRLSNEFASHKALDLLGDLYLLGMPLQGRVTAFKPGHDMNTRLARAILDNPDKVELVSVSNADAESVRAQA
ncbi:UDP-3-O-acyl-N-acetylglucosamine deacetylase [Parvularcula sp. IMCC14364]|uniref:UDP-3-O-acyl-N-acetylglucosamine deacetylase n=1 Tax=Parvularcula sp. IMCC14364 TaxID=3067902 RepID=UPI0027410F43|nr:UDP-3-O-acyl-N-acetylglucosamine deacetylase [Parvularcula sp. IMCC14364]